MYDCRQTACLEQKVLAPYGWYCGYCHVNGCLNIVEYGVATILTITNIPQEIRAMFQMQGEQSSHLASNDLLPEPGDCELVASQSGSPSLQVSWQFPRVLLLCCHPQDLVLTVKTCSSTFCCSRCLLNNDGFSVHQPERNFQKPLTQTRMRSSLLVSFRFTAHAFVPAHPVQESGQTLKGSNQWSRRLLFSFSNTSPTSCALVSTMFVSLRRLGLGSPFRW